MPPELQPFNSDPVADNFPALQDQMSVLTEPLVPPADDEEPDMSIVEEQPPSNYNYDYFEPPYVKEEPHDPYHIFSPPQPAPWIKHEPATAPSPWGDAKPTLALPPVKEEHQLPFSNPFGREVWYNVEPGLEYDANDRARHEQALLQQQMDLVSEGDNDSMPTLETYEPPDMGKEVLQSEQPSDVPAPAVVVPYMVVDRGVAEAKEEDHSATVDQLMHGDSGALTFSQTPAQAGGQLVLHAEPQMQVTTPGSPQKRSQWALGRRKKERDAEGNLQPPPIDYDPNPPAPSHEKTIYHDNGRQHKREWRQGIHAGKMIKGDGHDQSNFAMEEPDWDYNVYEPQEFEPDGNGGWKHQHHDID